MILATFMVMLAAYNLSPRADIAHIQNAPQAEAAITKFLYQHKVAEKFTKDQIAGETVTPGDIDISSLVDYLPIGFKYDEGSYASVVYCLNPETKDAEGNISPAGQIVSECFPTTGNKKVRYVITFGQVPDKWKNVATNKVLGDFYKALRSRIPVSMACGIVTNATQGQQNNKMGSTYVIEGVDAIVNASIPPYFIATDTIFTDKCLKDGELSDPCLICVTNL